jgi:hypothetical protein
VAGGAEVTACLCGAGFVEYCYLSETTVGFFSPPGHDHNDNCLSALFLCVRGHSTRIAKVRTCPVEGCDWRGRTTCSACRATFVDEVPDVADARAQFKHAEGTP